MQDVQYLPLTVERWADLEALFGERGAVGGCWCMTPRLSHTEYEAQKGEGNRRAMRAVVESGEVPGIVAYVGGAPAGWCAVAPRETYPRLERSRVARRIDDRAVWSVVCFFIGSPYRRRGLSAGLLTAAVEHARGEGATVVEGYPVEPQKPNMPEVFAWTGMAGAFRDAGFVEVARRTPTRPFMRYFIEDLPA